MKLKLLLGVTLVLFMLRLMIEDAKHRTPEIPQISQLLNSINIVEDVAKSKQKRRLRIILFSRFELAQLRALALEVQALNSTPENIFINFYIKDQDHSNGAWALAAFTPNLSLKIMGMTEAQLNILATAKVAEAAQVLGIWIDDIKTSRASLG